MPTSWGSGKTASLTADDATRLPPDLAHWWEQLNDATLNRLVEQEVAGNLDVATAKARVRQARATRRQALAALAPTLTGSGSYSRADNGSNVSDTGDVTVSGPFDTFNLGANASWELDLFGENRRAAEAAKYGLDASEESLRNTLLVLIGDVTTSYVE
ncbi:MAG: RND transporter, partial [Starkeya sp.]|nr:RND transporter [Starkeya sp.]